MNSKEIRELTKEAKDLLSRLDDIPDEIPKHACKILHSELESISDDLKRRMDGLDPVKAPTSFFDPADPRLFGTFAAIALIGQDRVPLASAAEKRFYGAGIYAIYYAGDYPLYGAISRTETPIYVGKADPSSKGARSWKQQGTPLSSRLDEHRKNIGRAKNLDVSDFSCRYLAVASGWQGAAESALIELFGPLWNKETKLLLGFGKHGDSSDTRRNKRSPWDVLHPGREWALGGEAGDAKTPQKIEEEVAVYLVDNPPVADVGQVFHQLMERIKGS